MGTEKDQLKLEHEESTRRTEHETKPFVHDVDEYSKNRSSEEIEHEIELTRLDMDRILDELGESLHPRNLVRIGWQWYQSDISSAEKEKLKLQVKSQVSKGRELIRDNPVSTMLVAGGLLLALTGEDKVTQKLNRRYQTAKENLDSASQRVKVEFERRKEDLKERAHSVYEDLDERISQGKDEGLDRGHHLKEELSEKGHDMYEKGRERANRLVQRQYKRGRERYRDYPFVLGGLTLGLGMLLGSSIPATRQERQMMGEHSVKAKRKLAEEAKDLAQDVIDRGTEKGHEILDEVEQQKDSLNSAS